MRSACSSRQVQPNGGPSSSVPKRVSFASLAKCLPIAGLTCFKNEFEARCPDYPPAIAAVQAEAVRHGEGGFDALE